MNLSSGHCIVCELVSDIQGLCSRCQGLASELLANGSWAEQDSNGLAVGQFEPEPGSRKLESEDPWLQKLRILYNAQKVVSWARGRGFKLSKTKIIVKTYLDSFGSNYSKYASRINYDAQKEAKHAL